MIEKTPSASNSVNYSSLCSIILIHQLDLGNISKARKISRKVILFPVTSPLLARTCSARQVFDNESSCSANVAEGRNEEQN